MSNRYEGDRWGFDAPSISSPERLAAIKQALEQSPIIVEHRFYRGSCAPDRLVFEDYEVFTEYLHAKVRPGDSLWFWRFDQLCRDDNCLTHGKFPDTDGMVPSGGAY
ncbi:MAG: hypothetical protein H0X66_17115 [Verrucomicrobia bacterium]|nr:hypothetical protein [Verrucomicrobiota bacterium]